MTDICNYFNKWFTFRSSQVLPFTTNDYQTDLFDSLNGILIGTTTSNQSGPGSNGNQSISPGLKPQHQREFIVLPWLLDGQWSRFNGNIIIFLW